MQKILRNAVRKGAEYTIPLLSVTTGVDMGGGILYGLDSEGKAVIADATLATPIHAVGITTITSEEEFGEAFKLNGADILREGTYIDVYTHAVVYAEETMSGKVGDAVYLGAEGKLTLVAPAIATNIVQKVGVLCNPKTGAVRLAIMDKGEVVA